MAKTPLLPLPESLIKRRKSAGTPVADSPVPKVVLLRVLQQRLSECSGTDLAVIVDLIEQKRSGRTAVIFSVPQPDEILDIAFECKAKDGSVLVAQFKKPRPGFVLIEPKRRKTPLDEARSAYDSIRNELVARSLPLTKAAKRMGLSTEGLSDRVQHGKMLAFSEHNKKMVPLDLIDDTRDDRTVQGLSKVIEASPMEPFGLAVWLLHPAESLGEKRPVDELRAGNVERVVRAVRGVGAT